MYTMGISRNTYYSHKKTRLIKKKNKENLYLVNKIKEIKPNHPFWVYRQITVWLNDRKNTLFNEKINMINSIIIF